MLYCFTTCFTEVKVQAGMINEMISQANTSRMLTYPHVSSRMLTYAHVCWRMLTYAEGVVADSGGQLRDVLEEVLSGVLGQNVHMLPAGA